MLEWLKNKLREYLDCPNCEDCDWINPDEIGDYLAEMGDSKRDPNG